MENRCLTTAGNTTIPLRGLEWTPNLTIIQEAEFKLIVLEEI
jgi:hypothetical protein